MKNIHIIPTDKPSRLSIYDNTLSFLKFEKFYKKLFEKGVQQPQNIYITSDEEIKRNDYWINVDNNTISNGEMFELANDAPSCKKIILTTDLELQKNGVQSINNDFLEWFVKNPSCEKVLVTNLYGDFNPIKYFYEIIIPKEKPKKPLQKLVDEGYGDNIVIKDDMTYEFKPKQKILEEASKIDATEKYGIGYYPDVEKAFIRGAKWQQDKNKYSEEELRDMLQSYVEWATNGYGTYYDWFEQFKKK